MVTYMEKNTPYTLSPYIACEAAQAQRKDKEKMNKVMLMGRLVRQPEVRYTQGENPIAVAKYTLAVDRNFKKDEEKTADFIRCVCFGRQAMHAEKYYYQGLKIAVCGKIQTGSYTNKDGNKIYTTDVIVDEQYFAESKAKAEENTLENTDGFVTIDDVGADELPFI